LCEVIEMKLQQALCDEGDCNALSGASAVRPKPSLQQALCDEGDCNWPKINSATIDGDSCSRLCAMKGTATGYVEGL